MTGSEVDLLTQLRDSLREPATPERLLITAPGVYPDMDERTYHSDPVAGGSLSSTGAKTLIGDCAAMYEYQRDHGRPDKTEFDVGHVAHAQLLGVGGKLVIVPGTGADPEKWQKDDDKKKVAEIRAAGNTPLKPSQAARVRRMVAAVRAHDIAGPLFARPGRAEQSLIARDPESGIMCRARPDWMPSDIEPGERLIVADLKTTSDSNPLHFGALMAKFGYHQQDPFYCDVLHWLDLTRDPATGELIEPLFLFVAVRSDPPHLVSVGRPVERAREWGRVLNRKARDVWRECTATGVWPGYEPRVHDLELPYRYERGYELNAAAGRFDTLADLEAITDDDD